MFAKKPSVVGKIITMFVIISILFSVSACSDAENSITPTVQPTAISSLTPVIISPVLIPTAVSTRLINAQPCWAVRTLGDSKTTFPGSLLYLDSESGQSTLFDLSNYKTKAANSRALDTVLLNISHDGSMIATIDNDTDILRLDFQNQYREYPIPDYVFFGGFLSDNRVWLGRPKAVLKNYIFGTRTTDEYYILSLVDGTWTPYSVTLPKFWTNVPVSTRIESYVRYSPDLNYVIYSAKTPEIENILLNLKTSEVVWQGGELLGFFYPLPIWSPDSNEVAFAQFVGTTNRTENIYRISVDGIFSQSTHLENTLGLTYFITGLSWSPNGRYLAFSIIQDENLLLFILDLNSDALLNACISENDAETMRNGFSLVWSPDGNQLALTSGGKARWVLMDPATNREVLVRDPLPDLLVLDVPNKEIYRIPANTSNLLGWLSWELP